MRTTLRILLLAALAFATGCGNDTLSPIPAPTRDCPDPYARTGTCTDLSDYIHTVGLLNTGGAARSVYASDSWVYVADGDDGALVVDACNPSRLSVTARVPTPGPALSVTGADGRLYVASGDGGLSIVDIHRPETAREVGRVETAGAARDVAVSVRRTPRPPKPVLAETFACIADDVVGLMVVDVSDPASPEVKGVENTPGSARAVCVDGDLAYVADAELGLRIVSVASPESPWLVGAVATPGVASDVVVWNGVALVADGLAGLTVIDVSTPSSATVLRTIDTAGRATAVTVGDGFAFLADDADGVLVYDLSNPAAPRLVSRSHGEGMAVGLSWWNGLLFAADAAAGIRVVDVTDPLRSPVLAQTQPVLSNPVGLTSDGDDLYVISATQGMFLTRWRGDHFSLPSTAYTGGTPSEVLPYEGFVYVAAGDVGVKVVDVGDPDRLTVAPDPLPGSLGAIDVAIADSVAFFARGLSRPVMLDMRTGLLSALHVAFGVTRAVDTGAFFAYLVQVQGKIFVADLRPDSPQLVRWGMLTHGKSVDVVVRGDVPSGEWLFVANQAGLNDTQTGEEYSAGVEVYDLSDPMVPEFVTLIETSIPAQRIVFSGDIMFVLAGDDGLEVFDVSDVHAPVAIGAYWWDGPITDAAVVDGAIILPVGADGLIALPPLCAR